MNEFFASGSGGSGSSELLIATVGSSGSGGTTLCFNNTAATGTKFKRVVTGQSLSAGDMVLVAHVGGGYVVIGKIAY